MLILALIVSIIPFTALYLWLRNHLKAEEEYKKFCDKTLKQGFLCVFPVAMFSMVSHIILALTKVQDTNPFLYKALYNFIVLALSEELTKFLIFRRTLKKSDNQHSWLDVTVLMTIVGIGFGLLESVVYAIGASVPVILVRGICVPHVGYGFISGYFYGKGLKTGNSNYKWFGIALAWFIHGLYDFSLSEEFLAVNDNLVIVPLLLAMLDIVLAIVLVSFTKKARRQEKYTAPLPAVGVSVVPAE